MGRDKLRIGSCGMCIEYAVTEKTTHKTVTASGKILRTDGKGFYIQHDADGKNRMSWHGSMSLFGGEHDDYEWEEEEFSREYDMEYDVS